MCYMKPVPAEETVGIRELRQNLSVYLARVATGTVFRVTDRGTVVALLVPLPPDGSIGARLVASGRADKETQNLDDLGATTAGPVSLSEAVRGVRVDRL